MHSPEQKGQAIDISNSFRQGESRRRIWRLGEKILRNRACADAWTEMSVAWAEFVIEIARVRRHRIGAEFSSRMNRATLSNAIWASPRACAAPAARASVHRAEAMRKCLRAVEYHPARVPCVVETH
jgi:hypothetical protein